MTLGVLDLLDIVFSVDNIATPREMENLKHKIVIKKEI